MNFLICLDWNIEKMENIYEKGKKGQKNRLEMYRRIADMSLVLTDH